MTDKEVFEAVVGLIRDGGVGAAWLFVFHSVWSGLLQLSLFGSVLYTAFRVVKLVSDRASFVGRCSEASGLFLHDSPITQRQFLVKVASLYGKTQDEE